MLNFEREGETVSENRSKLMEQLEAVEEAIFSNVKIVKFDGKEVHFKTTNELLNARDILITKINSLNRNRPNRRVMIYDPR